MNIKAQMQRKKTRTYCNGLTDCNWGVHLAGCTGWMETARRNQQPEEDRQEEPVAAAGSVAGIPAAGHSLPAGPGSQAVVGHKLLAGSSYFGCN